MFSDGYPESLEVNVAGAVGVRPTWHADSRNTFVGLSGRAVTAISVQPPLALSNVTVRSGTRRTAVTRCANHTMSAPLCPRGTEECIIGRRRQRPRLCRSGRVGTLRTSARNLREEARHRSPAVPGSAGYSAFGPGPGDGGAAAAASGRGGTDPKERIVSQPLTRRGGLVWGAALVALILPATGSATLGVADAAAPTGRRHPTPIRRTDRPTTTGTSAGLGAPMTNQATGRPEASAR